MHPFEIVLSVQSAWLDLELRAFGKIPWADFWLNPRRLRGSDFLMRWSQGRWSETRLIEATGATGLFFALPYGPSGAAPQGDVRAFELYFERLEQAGLGKLKKPDLLIFQAKDRAEVEAIVGQMGGLTELPFIRDDDSRARELLGRAVLAVECENSLWRAARMPDFGAKLKPQKRLGGLPGLRKNAVLPTVIIKEEDRKPLLAWQDASGVKVHVWHVFYDCAYGLALDEAERLVTSGLTPPVELLFQAPNGVTTVKTVYKHYYHYAYPLAVPVSEPELLAAFVEDKNGHILPYVRFSGGRLRLTEQTLQVLKACSA